MKLGFIGTGKITSSVITGICNSSIKYNRIFVSSRNNKISKNLKKRFKKISIEKNNQKIIDSCSWIFLAVTRTVGKKIFRLQSSSGAQLLLPQTNVSRVSCI